jgi:UDP-N-acetylmuramate-alanine ligase
VIACVDDENVRNIIPRLKRRVIKYGLDQKGNQSRKY